MKLTARDSNQPRERVKMVRAALPSRPRTRAASTRRRPRISIKAILRAAYRRHGRSKLTVAAVKRCLGTA